MKTKPVKKLFNFIKKQWISILVNSLVALLIAWIVSLGVVNSVIYGHGSKVILIFKNQPIIANHELISEPIKYGDSGGFHSITFRITDTNNNHSEQEIKISYELSSDGKNWATLLDETIVPEDFIDKKVQTEKWYYKRQRLAPARYIRYKFQLKNSANTNTTQKLSLDLEFYKLF